MIVNSEKRNEKEIIDVDCIKYDGDILKSRKKLIKGRMTEYMGYSEEILMKKWNSMTEN